MKSSRLTAVLLTFFMFLVVLASAVYFLWERSRDFEQQVDRFVSDVETLEGTREILESDLAVLQSAYQSSEATREAVVQLSGQISATASAIEYQQSSMESASADEVVPEDAGRVDILFFAPTDGAVVRPKETITLYLAARAESGVDRIELAIDDEEPVSYSAGGLITFTLPVLWEVVSEGEYTITATAIDTAGQTSSTETIRVNAEYTSDEERQNALRTQQIADLMALRFPPEPAAPEVSSGGQENSAGSRAQILSWLHSPAAGTVSTRTMVLRAFDLIPPGYDLAASDQAIQGLRLVFDTAQTARVIGSEEITDSDASALWANAHDLIHQIQMDSLGLAGMDPQALGADANLALLAMIEGETAFLQQQYLNSESFSDTERQGIMTFLDDRAVSTLDSLPVFLRQEFEFAYRSGYEFINQIYSAGGIEALDALWKNPPSSTEQIIHPDRYSSGDLPKQPSLDSYIESTLTEGWQRIVEDQFGEFYLRSYLSQSLSPEEVEPAATGLGGGTYALYINEEENLSLLLLLLAWDALEEQGEFETAFRAFMNRRLASEGVEIEGGGFCWEQEQNVCITSRDGESLIVLSSDEETVLTFVPSIITR